MPTFGRRSVIGISAIKIGMPIFTEDMPMTMLLPRIYSSAAHRKIKGLSNIRVDPIWYMEHLWIEEEQ